MIEHSLKYYVQGFSLCNYVSKQITFDSLSELVRVMKDYNAPSETIYQIIQGWSNWLVDSITLTGLKVDVILRVPGHNETSINHQKALQLIAQNVASSIGATFLPDALTNLTQLYLKEQMILSLT